MPEDVGTPLATTVDTPFGPLPVLKPGQVPTAAQQKLFASYAMMSAQALKPPDMLPVVPSTTLIGRAPRPPERAASIQPKPLSIGRAERIGPTTPRGPLEIAENIIRAPVAGLPLFNKMLWGPIEATGDILGLPSVAAFGREASKQADALSERIKGSQRGAGEVEQWAYGGLQSIGQTAPSMAAGLIAGPGAALALMGASTGGDAYRQAREEGVAPTEALAFAVSQAVVEVATERIPASRLLSDIAKKTPLMKTIMAQLVEELPNEQVATFLQDLNEWAVLPANREKPLMGFLEERPSAAAQTFVATLTATIGQTGALSVVDRLARTGEAKRLETQQREAVYQDLFGTKAEPSLDKLLALRQDLQLGRQSGATEDQAAWVEQRIAVVDSLIRNKMAPALPDGAEGPQPLPLVAFPTDDDKPTTIVEAGPEEPSPPPPTSFGPEEPAPPPLVGPEDAEPPIGEPQAPPPDAPPGGAPPAPADPWTHEGATAFLNDHADTLNGAGFTPRIVGGVAELGQSANDLDVVLEPIEQGTTLEGAVEAFENEVLPQISDERIVLNPAAAPHDGWFMNVQLRDGRIAEFYLPNASFPLAEEQPAGAPPAVAPVPGMEGPAVSRPPVPLPTPGAEVAPAPAAANPTIAGPAVSRPPVPLPTGAVDKALDEAVREIAAPGPTGAAAFENIKLADLSAAMAQALNQEAEQAPGPRWRPGSEYDIPDNAPEDVIAATVEEQMDRRLEIDRLTAQIAALPPGEKRYKLTKTLAGKQEEYDGVWQALESNLDDLDLKALQGEVETGAQAAAEVAREKQAAEDEAAKKKEKKEKEEKEEKAAKPKKEAKPKEPEAKPKTPAPKEEAETEEAEEPKATETWAVGDNVVYRREAGLVTAIDADGQVHVSVLKEVPGKKPKKVDVVVAPGAIVRDPLTDEQHARLEELSLKEDGGAELTEAENEEFAELQSTLGFAMDESSEATRRPQPAFQAPVREWGLGQDRMDPDAVFPPPETTARLPNVDHEKEWTKRQAEGYFITPEEAAKRLAAWKAEAKRLGTEEDNSKKVIYSLFDRTGNWSQPYVDAGYIVRRYDITEGQDLLEFFPSADIIADKEAGLEVVGVLAAPPCPTFTLSATRWWKTLHDQKNQEHLEKLFGYHASRHFERPVDYALALIDITKAFVEFAAPSRFHVLENPIGRLHTSLAAMPQPTLVFHPAHYGDPQTKKTFLWGMFNPDLPTAPVYPTEGSRVSDTLRGDDPVEKLERSATSEHFAYAFFMGNRFDDQVAQAPTAEAEPETPTDEPTVIAFRSGNQSAINDLVGFIKAGQDVGVTALGMTGPVRDAIVAHVASGGNAFIDSGAFGKTEIVNGKGVPKINFKAVMSAYGKLATDVVNAGGETSGLYVVAPDVAPAFVDKHDQNKVVPRAEGIPRSFPEETKAIQDEYADNITAALDGGLNVIVPVQVGPTMAARAVEVLEQFPDAMIGLPGNQRAISDEQLTELLAAIEEADQDPPGFHFLGIGEENKRFKKLVELVHGTFPDAVITVDSSRAQAMFVEGRPAQQELKDRVLQYAAADVDEAWESDTTELAGEFYRGNFETFNADEFKRIAEALNTTSLLLRRAGKPDQVLALVEESGLEDAFFETLWYIARDRGAGRKSVTTKARTDVIAETDHPARTFKYGEAATHEGRPAVVQSFLPEHPSGPSYQIQVTEEGGGTVFMTVPAAELEKAKKATSQPPVSRPTETVGDWDSTKAGLVKTFTFENVAELNAFTDRLKAHTDAVDHHPDIQRVSTLAVTLTYVTHDAGDTITQKDRDGARAADRLAEGGADAIQEPGAATGPVREGPRGGEEVREGDAEGGEAAGEGEISAEEVADRPKYPDGRLKPQVGDKVYQTVGGFGGSPAHIYGEVFKGRGDELRVKMTGSASLMGGGSTSVGKTQKLNEYWTVVNDPEVARRRAAREQAEKDRKEQNAREEAEFQVEVRRKSREAIEGGHRPLTRETPAGARVMNYYSGEIETVTQDPEFGPLVDNATIGNPDSDGSYGGYSVLPDQTYSVAAMKDAFRLTDPQADAADVGRQQMQVKAEDLLVAKDGIAGDGALRQVAPVTDMPAFQAWFRNSMVVDADDRPLVVYHGTPTSFTAFKPGGTDPRASGPAMWFTPNRTEINAAHNIGGYEGHYKPGTHVMPVYLSVQAPLRVTDKNRNEVGARFGMAPGSGFPRLLTPKLVHFLKAQGYDGIFFTAKETPEVGDLADEIIVFDPTQIKSAIGNRGTYDPTSPNILYQRDAPFYSRLQRAVEETAMQKATGYKWKGVIAKWAKGKPTPTIGTPTEGVGRGDYVFAHVDDLENHKEYTKQEVLDYLKANELQVQPVVLGNRGTDPDPRSDDELKAILWQQGYGVEDDSIDDADPLMLYRSVPDPEPVTRPAYMNEPVDIDDLDIDIPQDVVDAYNVLNRRHLEPEDDAVRAERWSEPGGDPGTYREVILRVPADRTKTAARDRAKERVKNLRDRQRDLGDVVDRPTLEEIEDAMAGVRTHNATSILAMVDVTNRLKEAEAELAAREKALGGWKDGHTFYDDNSDYDNPIARVRFDLRTQPDGTRVMFLQEVQPPHTDQPMPAELRKHSAAIGFKWALRYAAENGLDRVAFTTGEMQAKRYSIEQVVDSLDWIAMPVMGEGRGILRGFKAWGADLNAREVFTQRLHRDEIEKHIGDLAKPLLAQPRDPQTGVQTLDREGMKVGGRGLKNLYDKVYPALVNDIPAVKAAGVKVDTASVGGTLKTWAPVELRADAEASLARKFRAEMPLDDILRTFEVDDARDGTLSLAALYGDAIRHELEWDYGYGNVGENAPTPEALARAVINIMENRGRPAASWWMESEPAIQVPGVDITPAVRERVLGGQPLFQGAQGSTEFMVDGKALIRGFEGANVSTALHELFHVARRQRLNRAVPAAARGGITDADLDVFEEWAGFTDARTREEQEHAEEKAARGFERYLREGTATFANETVQKVFEAIKQWMLTIYVQLEGSAIDIDISPAVRAIFDKLVGAEMRAALQQEQPAAPKAAPLASRPPVPLTIEPAPPNFQALRRRLDYLTREYQTSATPDVVAKDIHAIEAQLLKHDALPEGYTLLDAGQKNLPSPDAAAITGQTPDRPPTKSFKAEVTDGSSYASNALRFATREEAEQYADDLMSRWMGARDSRVVESDDPVANAFKDGRVVYLEREAPAPAVSPEQAAIDARLAALKAEAVEIQKRIRAKINRANTGVPLDLLDDVIALAINYVQQGIETFRDAALLFRETYGEDADAERAFELAWPVVQNMAKGQTMHAALETAIAQKNRPKVAAEVKAAYTEAGGSRGGEQPEAGVHPGRPAAKPGRRGIQPIRASGEGSLGTVPADPDRGTAGAGAVETGGSDTPAGVSPNLPGASGTGTEPGDAAGPDRGDVPGGDVPTAGGTAGPGGITGNKPSDYQLTPERIAGIINRTDMPRLKDNIAAIRLVKDLQTDHRYPTPDEQELLAKYVGWGAASMKMFLEDDVRDDWSANQKALWAELRDLTTETQRKELIRTTPNAHYTYDLYRPIWNALASFGFTGGRVLEPSVGTGHAFGFMDPTVRKNSTLRASELDPLTAAIAGYLYPSAKVQAVGFENILLPRNTQDLIISNVPFGPFAVADKMFTGSLNFLTEKIHSYFFAKAMEYVRPGGYIVFVTSRYTLDGTDHTDIRRYLMTKGHFVGAVRLPGGKHGAFVEGAKTQVVTDLIVLQKFAEGETVPRNKDEFLETTLREEFSTAAYEEQYMSRGKWKTRTVPAVNVYRSTWYDKHPELLLGTESNTGKTKREGEYTVEATADADIQAQLERALNVILPAGTYQPATSTSMTEMPAVAEGAFKPGEFRAGPKNTVLRVLDSTGEIVDATPTKRNGEVDTDRVQRILGQIKIRDARRAVVAAMLTTTATDDEIEALQATLLKVYKAFVKKHEHLNTRENVAAFKLDPESSTLRGLETIKTTVTVVEKNGKKKRQAEHTVIGLADIFDKRTINAPKTIEHVDTPLDAMIASLGTRAVIDWAYMARITGDGTVTPERIAALQQDLQDEGAIFEQPDGAWIARDEYLSGDVVSKLADVRAAAEYERRPTSRGPAARRGRYQANIDALESVQPAPKTIAHVQSNEIKITLGVHWVDPADVARFVDDTLRRRGTQMRLVGTEQFVSWVSEYPDDVVSAGNRHPLRVKYGNPDLSEARQKVYGFTDLVDDALNLKVPRLGYSVKNDDGTSTYYPQEEQTMAARGNLEEVRQLWTDWVYANREVLPRVLDIYNTRYNRTVTRKYDGTHLANIRNAKGEAYNEKGEPFTLQNGGVRTPSLPGLALDYGLYIHQVRAIWRILTSGNTLLAHEVGAGKTLEMIVAAMEMRRTGRARKPMITVPTHLLGQWKNTIAKAYPTAKLLAFDEQDLEKKAREVAMSRIANGDWDIVLVPHSSFELLKVSNKRMIATLEEWIAEIEAALAAARAERGEDDPSVGELETARRKIETKVRKLLAKADKGGDNAQTWESLGVDALFVDEAHAFKNLFFFTQMERVRGISADNTSDKSLDLFVKIKEINESSNYRNLVFATATPVMNSLAEVYTMQRYLQPHRLKELGFENFDNWYRTFGVARLVTEKMPNGSYEEVMRVADFKNLKLLHRIAAEMMDYVGWADMPYLKIPAMKGGEVELVVGEPHPMYPSSRSGSMNGWRRSRSRRRTMTSAKGSTSRPRGSIRLRRNR